VRYSTQNPHYQEVSFHLSSNQVIFAQLIQLHDGTFTATVTQAHDKASIPSTKYFSWLACPDKASAQTAFREVISAIQHLCQRNGNSTLVKVNNPCNCEFLSAQEEQNIAGQSVSVVVNESI
jgi:hypothetical protein